MGFAFQIQVRGALNGTTQLVWPDPLPAPVNGVYQIDAGVGVNVGLIDFESLPDFDGSQGYWLRAYQIEAAVGVLGLRSWVPMPYQSAQQINRIHCDIGCANRPTSLRFTHFAGAAMAGLRTFSDTCFIPPGGQIAILTDSVSTAFGGVPVNGPHYVYLEVDPIKTSHQFNLVQQIVREARRRWRSEGVTLWSQQLVAASSTDNVFIPMMELDRFGATAAQAAQLRRPRAYKVRDIYLSLNTGTAVGETMRYQVFKRNATATTQLADRTVVASSSLGTARLGIVAAGAIDESVNVIDPGDQIQVVRTYVAGGGPTLTANTLSVRLTPLQH